MYTMVAFCRTIFAFFLLLVALPLPGEVFAQSNTVASSSGTVTDSLATSSIESILSTDIRTDKELWYKSDRIFGDINVGDFVVGPGRSEIEVSPGETIIQEVSVTNRISAGRTFMLEVEDVQGSSDGSSAISLTGSERGPYSIRDYINFPKDSFVLDLGERARIPVSVTIPPDAEPGGYYGSVLVSTIQDSESDSASAPRSPIIARVGSLFFVRVRGAVKTEGKTVSLTTLNNKWWYESGPVDLGILYENTGSVHVNPYGELSVKNMFGEEVGFIELDPWFVLPQSLRIRDITWDREFLLGRYTVDAKVNRGYEDIVDEVSVSFWVLPWKIVGGVFLILFVIIFSLRAFFRTFEFKRKSS